MSAKSDVKALAGFVAKSKASAKPLTYGSSGLSSVGQMVAQSFAMKAGLKFEIIPYKGGAEHRRRRQSHRLRHPDRDVRIGQLRGGTVAGLAVSAEQRLPDYPDVPTFKELWLRRGGDELSALAGPAGLPAHRAQGQSRDQYCDGEAREPAAHARGRYADPRQTPPPSSSRTCRRPVIEQAGLVEK